MDLVSGVQNIIHLPDTTRHRSLFPEQIAQLMPPCCRLYPANRFPFGEKIWEGSWSPGDE